MGTDEDRLLKLEERYADLNAEVREINAKLVPLERGVQNFISFQRRGTTYFDRAEAVLDANEKRRRITLTWAKIISPLVIAMVCWLAFESFTFTADMIKIDRLWHQSQRVHPGATFFIPQSFSAVPHDSAGNSPAYTYQESR